MNRTDRLLAIVLQLQTRRYQRAEDLAAFFEISKRTVYRDVMALCEAGVPVISIPGKGYSLMEGYFLPPLSFKVDEAIMLMLGADVMTQSFDSDYGNAAKRAAHKITAVLSDALREEVERMRESIRFITTSDQVPEEAERLQQLRSAILNQRMVRFRYHARHSRKKLAEQRDVNPYTLSHTEGAWYLVGYCHLRKGLRVFRLTRMENLEILPRVFVRPENFTFTQNMFEPRRVVIRLLFDEEAARWVQEDRLFYISDKQECDNGLLVTLHVRDLGEIVQWVLGWGRHVRVLEPESLRQRLIEEAQKFLQNHE